jgi:hypothetical protein
MTYSCLAAEALPELPQLVLVHLALALLLDAVGPHLRCLATDLIFPDRIQARAYLEARVEGEEGVVEARGRHFARRRARDGRRRGRSGGLLDFRPKAGEQWDDRKRRRVAQAEEEPAERRGGGGGHLRCAGAGSIGCLASVRWALTFGSWAGLGHRQGGEGRSASGGRVWSVSKEDEEVVRVSDSKVAVGPDGYAVGSCARTTVRWVTP